jgi:FtsH-binding integral membrane protein
MQYSQQGHSTRTISYDESLRGYMIRIYNYMSAALILTGSVAMLTAYSKNLITRLYLVSHNQVAEFSTFGWIVVMAPIGIALVFSFRLAKLKVVTAQIFFWTYAILLGLSLSLVCLIYAGENIAGIFFTTACIFGGMSLYGYATKADLTSLGAFLIMGLIGTLIASLVNLFFQSSWFNFISSVISVFVFVGLTAFDTQRIKAMHQIYNYSNGEIAAKIDSNGEMAKKIVIISALILYLDFVNIFIHLVRLFSRKKGR